MKPLLLLASLAAAAAFAACAHVAKSPAPRDSDGPINRYVAAEDNNFADLRGALQRSNASSAYYASREALPGASNCVVYDSIAGGDHLSGCTFAAKSLGDATALYHKWLENVQSALPRWKSANVGRPPQGDVAATIFSDDSQVHGVFVDIFGDSQSGYRVTTTFAKMSVLRS